MAAGPERGTDDLRGPDLAQALDEREYVLARHAQQRLGIEERGQLLPFGFEPGQQRIALIAQQPTDRSAVAVDQHRQRLDMLAAIGRGMYQCNQGVGASLHGRYHDDLLWLLQCTQHVDHMPDAFGACQA